jgi:stress-induced morphogen
MEGLIRKKIEDNLRIEFLQINNNSHFHVGHAESSGKDSHFELIIKSKDFDNKSLINCHRLINSYLKEEFQLGLHSITIKIVSRET